ncbi:MAG: hypothetical protein HY438_03280 [DPANN group archaeon]|nr:hypothetical protein [DPANN group archaeon]
MSLKDLEESLNRRETELAKAKRSERAEEHSHARAESCARKKDTALLGEKLKLAGSIMDWAGQFAGTKQFTRLRAINPYGYIDGVLVFGSGWGHQAKYEDFRGCHAGTYVNRNGNLKYWAGFKNQGGVAYGFATPKELAGRMNHEYLSMLWQAIDSGSIYDAIKRAHGLR